MTKLYVVYLCLIVDSAKVVYKCSHTKLTPMSVLVVDLSWVTTNVTRRQKAKILFAKPAWLTLLMACPMSNYHLHTTFLNY